MNFLCRKNGSPIKNVLEMICENNYNGKEYTIRTSDGYILTMHRIKSQKKAPVVLLMHGLLCSSAIWVDNGPRYSLAYQLADSGYDVFMGNVRGNVYSRKHVNLNPSAKQFWDFTFHEMGVHDLPAMLDFIKEKTNQERISYVGHSQGCIMLLTLLSTYPEWNNRIDTHYALAPVGSLTTPSNMIKTILKFFDSTRIALVRSMFGEEFLPHSGVSKFLQLFHAFIRPSNFIKTINLLSGPDNNCLIKEMCHNYLKNIPAGTSVKNMIHYNQIVKRGNGIFHRYDHGVDDNNKFYNSDKPPKYDFEKVTVRTHIHYGGCDIVANPKDIKILASTLNVDREPELYKTWNHAHFIWSTDCHTSVYNDIISNINQRFPR
ncbi:hypothetical protein A3Q56_06423 [Intoshia linei]|uniref:Lipase n=1 Tax=Intoshia linei TaxID=1819745 RepID=A0A177AWI0_9BILA|nr:hypothetical protein A3Q56_06423 [Intoshia linei]